MKVSLDNLLILDAEVNNKPHAILAEIVTDISVNVLSDEPFSETYSLFVTLGSCFADPPNGESPQA